MGNKEDSDNAKWFLCVKGFIVIFDRGVYDSALVSKCIYWTIGIDEDGINFHSKKRNR